MARICLAAPFRTERACSGVLGPAPLRVRGRGFDFIKLNRFALKHNMYWWLFSFPGFCIHTEIKNKRTANWNTDYCEPANKLSFSWRLFVVRTKGNKTKRVLADLADRACAVESAHSARVVSALFVRACVRVCVQLGWVRFCSGLRSRLLINHKYHDQSFSSYLREKSCMLIRLKFK